MVKTHFRCSSLYREAYFHFFTCPWTRISKRLGRAIFAETFLDGKWNDNGAQCVCAILASLNSKWFYIEAILRRNGKWTRAARIILRQNVYICLCKKGNLRKMSFDVIFNINRNDDWKTFYHHYFASLLWILCAEINCDFIGKLRTIKIVVEISVACCRQRIINGRSIFNFNWVILWIAL